MAPSCNVVYDVTLSITSMSIPPLIVEFLKQCSCQVSSHLKKSASLYEPSGRKITHFWPSWKGGLFCSAIQVLGEPGKLSSEISQVLLWVIEFLHAIYCAMIKLCNEWPSSKRKLFKLNYTNMEGILNSIVSNSYYGMSEVKLVCQSNNVAHDFRILFVFYQHPMWFISLKRIETCGLLLNKNIFDRVTV